MVLLIGLLADFSETTVAEVKETETLMPYRRTFRSIQSMKPVNVTNVKIPVVCPTQAEAVFRMPSAGFCGSPGS